MSCLFRLSFSKFEEPLAASLPKRRVGGFAIPHFNARLAEVMAAFQTIEFLHAPVHNKYTNNGVFAGALLSLWAFVLTSSGNNCASQGLPFSDLLPLLVKLPTLSVVFPSVKEVTKKLKTC